MLFYVLFLVPQLPEYYIFLSDPSTRYLRLCVDQSDQFKQFRINRTLTKIMF